MRLVGSLATQFAPPFSLVLHYFIAAVLFNLVSIATLFIFSGGLNPPFYLFKYAGVVHLFLLGFVMSTIFGALYQLIPVALEIPVFSFKAGYIQFYLYVSGVVLMVFSMLNDTAIKLLPVGGSLVFVAIFIFIMNFFISLRALEKFDITGKFLISANISLLIGISIGLFLAFNFVYGFYSGPIMKFLVAHIVFTVFGFVIMVIMGVSMVLLPMFSLAHKFNDTYINIAFYLMVAGVFLGGLSLLFVGNLKLVYLIFGFIGAATVLYLFQVFEIYRKRPRKTPDIGMDTMFYSHFLLGIGMAGLLLVPVWEKGGFITGFLIFYGFFNMLIYGSLYKIVPFLTWFHRFSSLVGKKKVPMLADMLPKKIPELQVIVALSGTVLTSLGIAVSNKMLYIVGLSLMVIASGVFIYIIYYVLSFKLEE